jgi:hypothetical protein
MSFSDSPEAVCTELARQLDAIPSVLSVTIVPENEPPRDCVELEVVAEATDRDTVPNSVMLAILHSSLGPAAIDPHNNPDYKRVIAR